MLRPLHRQMNLSRIGKIYYTGGLDGLWGMKSINAAKKFQLDYGLAADGIWGEKTNAASLRITKEVQALLNKCGCAAVIDGIAGQKTTDAILLFQRRNSLIADGVAGFRTLALLKKKAGESDQNSPAAGYLSKNFKESEFRCECGGKHCDGYGNIPKTENETSVDPRLVVILQRARDHFGKPVYITSGCRCKTINDKLGSDEGSRHRKGRAADCYIGRKAGVSDEALCVWFKKQPEVRYAYTGFGAVHMDV